MIEDDFLQFQDEWITAHELSGTTQTPTETAINRAFEILMGFEFGHVLSAIREHTATSKFKPTPSDVIAILEKHGIHTGYTQQETPKADEVIALARMRNTPLGVLASIFIGSFDLQNGDSYYLRQRAEAFLKKYQEYVNRCVNGDYSSHEIAVMKKYCVDCTAPLASGLPAPTPQAVKKLKAMAADVPALDRPRVIRLESSG